MPGGINTLTGERINEKLKTNIEFTYKKSKLNEVNITPATLIISSAVQDPNLSDTQKENIMQDLKDKLKKIGIEDFNSVSMDEKIENSRAVLLRKIEQEDTKDTKEALESLVNLSQNELENLKQQEQDKIDNFKLTGQTKPNTQSSENTEQNTPSTPEVNKEDTNKITPPVITTSEKFTYQELENKSFSMHKEDGSVFMFGKDNPAKFSHDKINDKMPYSIEDGILILHGMKFQKIKTQDKKIYFTQVGTNAKYYFEQVEQVVVKEQKPEETTKKEEVKPEASSKPEETSKKEEPKPEEVKPEEQNMPNEEQSPENEAIKKPEDTAKPEASSKKEPEEMAKKEENKVEDELSPKVNENIKANLQNCAFKNPEGQEKFYELGDLKNKNLEPLFIINDGQTNALYGEELVILKKAQQNISYEIVDNPNFELKQIAASEHSTYWGLFALGKHYPINNDSVKIRAIYTQDDKQHKSAISTITFKDESVQEPEKVLEDDFEIVKKEFSINLADFQKSQQNSQIGSKNPNYTIAYQGDRTKADQEKAGSINEKNFTFYPFVKLGTNYVTNAGAPTFTDRVSFDLKAKNYTIHKQEKIGSDSPNGFEIISNEAVAKPERLSVDVLVDDVKKGQFIFDIKADGTQTTPTSFSISETYEYKKEIFIVNKEFDISFSDLNFKYPSENFDKSSVVWSILDNNNFSVEKVSLKDTLKIKFNEEVKQGEYELKLQASANINNEEKSIQTSVKFKILEKRKGAITLKLSDIDSSNTYVTEMFGDVLIKKKLFPIAENFDDNLVELVGAKSYEFQKCFEKEGSYDQKICLVAKGEETPEEEFTMNVVYNKITTEFKISIIGEQVAKEEVLETSVDTSLPKEKLISLQTSELKHNQFTKTYQKDIVSLVKEQLAQDVKLSDYDYTLEPSEGYEIKYISDEDGDNIFLKSKSPKAATLILKLTPKVQGEQISIKISLS